MVDSFKPEKAEGLDCIIQFDINGDENFQCHAVIKDKTCLLFNGSHQNPSMTITSPSDVWMDICNGKLSGPVAYFNKNISVTGDLNLITFMTMLFH